MTMKGKKHVLFLTRWYPSDSDTMLGLFVRNHAKAAQQAGYSITIAYAAPEREIKNKGQFRYSVTRDQQLNEVIVYYKTSNTFSSILQLVAWIKAIRLAVRNEGKPDLIHAHILTRSALLARIISMYYRIPFLITEHWSRYYPENPGYKGTLRKFLTEYVVRKAAAVTVVSNRLYKSMRQAGISFNAEILPNVVDTSIFTISEVKKEKFTFINISCFEEKSKNLKLLLDAGFMLRNKGYDFELLFIGDGMHKRLIEQYALNLPLDVAFKGTLTPADTANELKQAHCLVLSSNYETFGIVVFEALSTGIPVISTDVADLAQLIDSESGIIVPVGDVEALCDAMEKVYKSYNLYDAEKMRSKVIDKCSMESVSKQIDQLYQKVTK